MTVNLKASEIKDWAIIIGVAYLAYKFFKPIDSILSIPGNITDGIKQTASNIAKITAPGPAYEQPKSTTTPTLPTSQLAALVGKQVFSSSTSADLRTLPKSNATLIKLVPKNMPVGYVFSAVNEVVAGQNKAWLAITATPSINAKIIGFIPKNRVSLTAGGPTISGFSRAHSILN